MGQPPREKNSDQQMQTPWEKWELSIKAAQQELQSQGPPGGRENRWAAV